MSEHSARTTEASIDQKSDSSSGSSAPSSKELEGGVQAWLTILGSSLVYFSTFGIINSFGFFQDLYQNTYLPETPSSTIAFVGTIQVTLMNVLAAPAGSLFDRYGLKYLYIFSGISISGALLALSFSHPSSLWQLFLIQGVFLGIAIAFGAQAAIVVCGQHFLRRRALTMGIVAAAGSIGGVVFPIVFSTLVPRVGFSWSLRITASVVALCYSIALYISRTKETAKLPKGFRALLDFKGFYDPRYAVLALGAFLSMLGQFVPYYYISAYYTIVKPNSPTKDFLLPSMNAASILGRVLGGFVADETGPANIVYPMTILSGIQCLSMWLITSNIGVLVAFVNLYGFCSGVFIAVLPAIVAQISPQERLGGRIGAFYCVLAIAQLVGSPIAGTLIKKKSAEGYSGLIAFNGTTILTGGVIIFLARILLDNNLRKRL